MLSEEDLQTHIKSFAEKYCEDVVHSQLKNVLDNVRPV
jgi:hypothetical protein